MIRPLEGPPPECVPLGMPAGEVRIPMTDPAQLTREIRRRNWQRAHRASDAEVADHCPADPGPEFD